PARPRDAAAAAARDRALPPGEERKMAGISGHRPRPVAGCRPLRIRDAGDQRERLPPPGREHSAPALRVSPRHAQRIAKTSRVASWQSSAVAPQTSPVAPPTRRRARVEMPSAVRPTRGSAIAARLQSMAQTMAAVAAPKTKSVPRCLASEAATPNPLGLTEGTKLTTERVASRESARATTSAAGPRAGDMAG